VNRIRRSLARWGPVILAKMLVGQTRMLALPLRRVKLLSPGFRVGICWLGTAWLLPGLPNRERETRR
jgi:hypothetical protein